MLYNLCAKGLTCLRVTSVEGKGNLVVEESPFSVTGIWEHWLVGSIS